MSVKKGSIQILKQNVGNDFAKDEFKSCFYQTIQDQTGKIRNRVKSSRTFKNTLSGFIEHQKWIEKNRDTAVEVHITMEPTGIYHEEFLYYFHEKSDYVQSVIVPNQTKAYAKSLGINTKTDKVDAKVLGLMGLERELRLWKPLSAQMRLLKQLCRERVSLQERKTSLTNRIHALEHGYDANKMELRRLRAEVKLIEKHLTQVENTLKEAVQKDPYLKERIDKILLVKGLGFITVITLIAETNGFALFTSRSQLVSYAGYDVVQYQSGTSVNGKSKISKRGNKYIRRALFFPAMSASQNDKKMKKLYERVWDRSGMKMKGNVAVQRKLLVLVYALFTKNQAYDPNYQDKHSPKKVQNFELATN